MPKFIESKESIEYKKRLKEFSQLINPKICAEDIEKIKQEILKKRDNYNAKI
jgi:hypothetical protein